jgi:hypothetical protein
MSTLALPSAPFTTTDLPTLGLTPRELRRACDRGTVRHLFRNVYVDAAVEDSVALRAAALHLVVARHHVVVDRTAAWLHGVDAYAAIELLAIPPIEVCARRGHTRSRRSGVRGRTRDLGDDDILEVEGVRVTTPLRTALDLGCILRRREAYASICALSRAHGLAPDELLLGADRFSKRRGVVQLRELIPIADPLVESPREAWTLLAIHDAGLPLPEQQVWVDVEGVPTYRLDHAYRQQRVCVEYNGAEWHDLTDDQRRYDADRRAWLLSHGWTIIVVRSGDFTGEALQRWLGELRRALAASYSTRRW